VRIAAENLHGALASSRPCWKTCAGCETNDQGLLNQRLSPPRSLDLPAHLLHRQEHRRRRAARGRRLVAGSNANGRAVRSRCAQRRCRCRRSSERLFERKDSVILAAPPSAPRADPPSSASFAFLSLWRCHFRSV
jgi:hypothetical protein